MLWRWDFRHAPPLMLEVVDLWSLRPMLWGLLLSELAAATMLAKLSPRRRGRRLWSKDCWYWLVCYRDLLPLPKSCIPILDACCLNWRTGSSICYWWRNLCNLYRLLEIESIYSCGQFLMTLIFLLYVTRFFSTSAGVNDPSSLLRSLNNVCLKVALSVLGVIIIVELSFLLRYLYCLSVWCLL